MATFISVACHGKPKHFVSRLALIFKNSAWILCEASEAAGCLAACPWDRLLQWVFHIPCAV